MKKENETCENCEKVKSGNTLTHCHKGKRKDVAFIFSCPGAKECCLKRPVAGETGKNLDELIKKLDGGIINEIEKCSKNKDKICRYDFRLTNSWKDVEFLEKTGRSEATEEEVLNNKNLKRLLFDLRGVKEDCLIFCFGKKAKFAIKELSKKESFKGGGYKIIYLPHLGLQSINQIEVEGENSNKRKEKRISKIVKCAKHQIDCNCYKEECDLKKLHPCSHITPEGV